MWVMGFEKSRELKGLRGVFPHRLFAIDNNGIAAIALGLMTRGTRMKDGFEYLE
jgi:hypothetical protein